MKFWHGLEKGISEAKWWLFIPRRPVTEAEIGSCDCFWRGVDIGEGGVDMCPFNMLSKRFKKILLGFSHIVVSKFRAGMSENYLEITSNPSQPRPPDWVSSFWRLLSSFKKGFDWIFEYLYRSIGRTSVWKLPGSHFKPLPKSPLTGLFGLLKMF